MTALQDQDYTAVISSRLKVILLVITYTVEKQFML